MRENINQRILLGAWLPYACRNGKGGRPQHTIRHAYLDTLCTLGFPKNCSFETWMNETREIKIWEKRVETYLELPKGSYNKYNTKQQAAELQNFENL